MTREQDYDTNESLQRQLVPEKQKGLSPKMILPGFSYLYIIIIRNTMVFYKLREKRGKFPKSKPRIQSENKTRDYVQ